MCVCNAIHALTFFPILAFLSTMAFLISLFSPIPIGIPSMPQLSSASPIYIFITKNTNASFLYKKNTSDHTYIWSTKITGRNCSESNLIDVRTHDHRIFYNCPISNFRPHSDHCTFDLAPLCLQESKEADSEKSKHKKSVSFVSSILTEMEGFSTYIENATISNNTICNHGIIYKGRRQVSRHSVDGRISIVEAAAIFKDSVALINN